MCLHRNILFLLPFKTIIDVRATFGTINVSLVLFETTLVLHYLKCCIILHSHILLYRESIVIVLEMNFEFTLEIFILGSPELQRAGFRTCLYVRTQL